MALQRGTPKMLPSKPPKDKDRETRQASRSALARLSVDLLHNEMPLPKPVRLLGGLAFVAAGRGRERRRPTDLFTLSALPRAAYQSLRDIKSDGLAEDPTSPIFRRGRTI